MRPVDRYPLERDLPGRSISWTSFFLFEHGNRTCSRIEDSGKVSLSSKVRIFPSRYGVTPVVDKDGISFTITRPGQYSVEIGEDGYQNGLLIFANPPETDRPDPIAGNYYSLTNATLTEINSVPTNYTGIYFKSGVHDIGVYHVPENVTNIYF